MLLRRVSIVTALILCIKSSATAIATTKPDSFLSQLPLSSTIAQTPTNSSSQQPRKQGWLKDLNLTSGQLKQIQAIRKRSQADINGKKQAIQQAKQEFEASMGEMASPDEVRKKYNQLKRLRQELSDVQFENTLAIRQVLNPEQRRKYADYMYKK